MDSENISKLIEQYHQGKTSPEEEMMLLDYIQNNPNTVSEQGYDLLVDKLVYEHSLLERKALFQDMMKNPPSRFSKVNIWTFAVLGILLVAGSVLLIKNSSKPSIIDSKSIITKNKTITNDSKDSSIASTKTNDVNKSFTSPIVEHKTIQTTIDSSTKTPENHYTTKPKDDIEVLKTKNDPLKTTVKKDDQHEAQTPIVSSKSCPDYSKEITTKTTKSEVNLNNGNIIVLSKNSTLEYSIDNETFSNETSFEHLAVGNYNLYIRDNANCSSTIRGIRISETWCLSDYKKDMVKGQIWQIPVVVSEVKNISIFNTKGQIVYTKTQGFTDVFEWEGTNDQGNELVEGFYKVVITYQKETCIFNVSILK